MTVFSRSAVLMSLGVSYITGCAGAVSTVPSGAPAAAITTAVVAAATVVAVGCKFQGCGYGAYCNKISGMCEVKKCGEGCPSGTICNEGMHVCQAPPPAMPPNDFLPGDRAIDNFMGQH